jgi:hypothetical protein
MPECQFGLCILDSTNAPLLTAVHVRPRVSALVPSRYYIRQWRRRGNSCGPFTSRLPCLSPRSHFAPFHVVLQLTELKMNYFSYWIRSQPDWWLDYKNKGTAAGWRATARREDYLQGALTLLSPTDNIESAMDPRGPRYALHVLMAAPVLTERQIDWVLDELPDFAARRVPRDHVQVSSSCVITLFNSALLSFVPSHLVSNGYGKVVSCRLSLFPAPRQA